MRGKDGLPHEDLQQIRTGFFRRHVNFCFGDVAGLINAGMIVNRSVHSPHFGVVHMYYGYKYLGKYT